MMVNLADIIVFDPNTAKVYGMAELAVSMNGNAIQITLPRADGGDPFTPMVQEAPKKKRRSRSARAQDKKLSAAFTEANRRYRKNDGSLRSGRTQADIARLAHKLKKKM
jgi:hypothetical protein